MVHEYRTLFIEILRLVAGCLLLFLLGITGVAVAQPHPVPFINQPLVPDAVESGGAGFTLTVNGTGFVSGSLVNWNGSARATTFVSSSKLTASIAASDIATAKMASVTVVNLGPGGGTSNVAFFEVTPPTSSVGLAAVTYATADRSYSMAVGDFNRDGKLDLAVADYATSTISVLLGNGDGTFQAHVEYATGRYPESVAVGDFNSDGKLDLVVSNNGSNTVSILLGNGDGTFQVQVEYATENLPLGVAVADFNRDGKLDLAVANSSANTVSILLGNGDGTFQPAVNYSAGGGSPAVGDFNQDGDLDLVVLGSDINVLLGNGDGTFQPPVSYSAGSNPTMVAVADFNADGKLDLAVTNNGSNSDNTVSILLGNGDGTFQAHVDYGTGSSNLCSVAVGDFNGDGRPDLVVADLFSTDVRLLLGNGDGTFGTAASYAVGPGPSSVALGDFNSDGILDIAVADSGSATVSVLLPVTTDSLSEASLTFANQAIGTSSATQTVTLRNTGTHPLIIGSIAMTGTNAGDFSQTNTCGSIVAAGGECTISVDFKPTQMGARTASITITDNTSSSPESLALSGTGIVIGPYVTLSPTSLSFTTQVVGTTSAAQSVTLTNLGTAAVSITSIKITGADPSDFAQTNTCGSSAAAGVSCTINVTFKPTLGGSRTSMLSVSDNAPGSPVSLTGVGTVVQLNPSNLNFGFVTVGSSKTLSTTLTNVGKTTLSISGITMTEPVEPFAQTNTCGSSVGGGGSCTISVTFTPHVAGGYGGDELSIWDNGGGNPQLVPLQGFACPQAGCHFK
jgi:hypothetical protein